MGSFAERLLEHVSSLLCRLGRRLPYGYPFDRYCAFVDFVHSQGRLPRRGNSFNDMLFFSKWDGYLEIDLVRLTTDKELAKFFIVAVLGSDKCVPTIAVLRTEAAIDAFDFREDWYVKGTASSGDCILVTQEGIDKTVLRSWLKRTRYHVTRERNYKNLTQKIIVEPNVRFSDQGIFYDIRFFAYRGHVKAVMLGFYSEGVPCRKFFDRDWNEIEIELGRKRYEPAVGRPKNLTVMIEAAEKLAAYFELVRIDMYTNEDQYLIGELTHCHANARQRFGSKSDEERFSRLIFD